MYGKYLMTLSYLCMEPLVQDDQMNILLEKLAVRLKWQALSGLHNEGWGVDMGFSGLSIDTKGGEIEK